MKYSLFTPKPNSSGYIPNDLAGISGCPPKTGIPPSKNQIKTDLEIEKLRLEIQLLKAKLVKIKLDAGIQYE